MENILFINGDSTDELVSEQTLEKLETPDEVEYILNTGDSLKLINDFYQGIRSLPKIIVLDSGISVTDGFLFAEAIRRLNLPQKEKVEIVMVPPRNKLHSELMEAKKAGICDFQTKTICSPALLNVLLTGLHKSQQMAESDQNTREKLVKPWYTSSGRSIKTSN